VLRVSGSEHLRWYGFSKNRCSSCLIVDTYPLHLSAVIDDMQFTVLQPTFASFYADDGTAVGILFRIQADQTTLLEALSDAQIAAASPPAPVAAAAAPAVVDTTPASAPGSVPTGPFLFCLNCVHTLKDPSVPRGARVCAVAIATELQFFNVFRVCVLCCLGVDAP
jgi:hypothetical protein